MAETAEQAMTKAITRDVLARVNRSAVLFAERLEEYAGQLDTLLPGMTISREEQKLRYVAGRLRDEARRLRMFGDPLANAAYRPELVPTGLPTPEPPVLGRRVPEPAEETPLVPRAEEPPAAPVVSDPDLGGEA